MKLFRILSLAIVAMTMMMTTSCGATDKALNAAIDQINKQLSEQSIPGIEKMSLSADDGYIIYNYIVDESVADIDQMKQSADDQKAMLLNQVVKDANQQEFIKLIKLADRGLKFSYKGNKSNKSYEIVFENDEL